MLSSRFYASHLIRTNLLKFIALAPALSCIIEKAGSFAKQIVIKVRQNSLAFSYKIAMKKTKFRIMRNNFFLFKEVLIVLQSKLKIERGYKQPSFFHRELKKFVGEVLVRTRDNLIVC